MFHTLTSKTWRSLRLFYFALVNISQGQKPSLWEESRRIGLISFLMSVSDFAFNFCGKPIHCIVLTTNYSFCLQLFPWSAYWRNSLSALRKANQSSLDSHSATVSAR